MDVRAREKKLPLVLRFNGVLPASIQTDRTRLRQILINLVSNAIKFTEHGRVEIVARFLSGQNLLQVEVIDTGDGIAPEVMQRLFGAFEQGDAGTTRAHGGSGLGLAISRKLAVLMDGSLDAERDPGRGSAFPRALRDG